MLVGQIRMKRNINYSFDGKEKDKKFGVGKYPINLYDILKEDFINFCNYSNNEASVDNFHNFIINNTFLAPNQVLYVKKTSEKVSFP